MTTPEATSDADVAAEIITERLEMICNLCIIQVDLLSRATDAVSFASPDQVRLATSLDNLLSNVKYVCEKAASLKCALHQR